MEGENARFARRPWPTPAAELLVPSAPGLGPLLRASARVERQSSKSDMATKKRGERLRAATLPTIGPQAPPTSHQSPGKVFAIVDVKARPSIRSNRSASPTVKFRCRGLLHHLKDRRSQDGDEGERGAEHAHEACAHVSRIPGCEVDRGKEDDKQATQAHRSARHWY